MAEKLVVQVTKKTVEEKMSSKGKPYKTIRITDELGNQYSGFLNLTDHNPSEGELVNLTIQPNEKNGVVYNNIQKIESLDQTALPKKPKSKIQSSSTAVVHTTVTTLPNKDISMEVSGLLQAIITKHGLDDKTSDRLKEAIKIKRLAAAELESGVI